MSSTSAASLSDHIRPNDTPGVPVVELRGITRTYFKPDGTVLVQALRGVDLTIEAGEYVAIMGASGSGKSTMMNLLGCLDRPSGGDYLLDGRNVALMDDDELSRVRGQKIGFIFQAFNLIGDLTVYENVELPLTYRGMAGSERKKRVTEALEKVEMAHRVKHYPSQLSGGQQQRVAVARAIAGDPAILLADEPTGNLDSKNGGAVMDLLRGLHQEGGTICMVTHDPRYADHAQKTVNLFDGQIVSEENGEKIDALAEIGF